MFMASSITFGIKFPTYVQFVNDNLGDEHISSPTTRELAVFPSLGDAWEDLGVALSIDDDTLQSIDKKSPITNSYHMNKDM